MKLGGTQDTYQPVAESRGHVRCFSSFKQISLNCLVTKKPMISCNLFVPSVKFNLQINFIQIYFSSFELIQLSKWDCANIKIATSNSYRCAGVHSGNQTNVETFIFYQRSGRQTTNFHPARDWRGNKLPQQPNLCSCLILRIAAPTIVPEVPRWLSSEAFAVNISWLESHVQRHTNPYQLISETFIRTPSCS
jgi:hypothetical protein